MLITQMIKYCWLACVLLLVSCVSDKEDKIQIESSLGLKLKSSIDRVHYFKLLYDPSYLYPYNEYILLEANAEYFSDLVHDLKLTKSDTADIDSLLCLTRKDHCGYYGNEFKYMTSINNPVERSEEVEKDLDWWKSNKASTVNTYVGYYNDKLKNKIVQCNEKWTGRIAVQYLDGKIYILIERFM